MAEKVSLTIDDIPVEVEEGSTILDVARDNNIYIPTLCHHPSLASFGACRLCLVEVEGAGSLMAACTTPVAEEMVVQTNTPLLTGIRKNIIELLLLHHPLDCLVCDKGGECELQDLSFKLQVTENSLGCYAPEPVSLDNTNFLIQRDTRKCMMCGKCVRVCDELRNIGALGYAHHGMVATIGYPEKQLANCEFCGQCLSVCPVGALSSKSAYEARPWELESVASVCPYCGCGCSYYLEHKKNKIVKVRSEEDLGANDGMLCVKGRFGYDFVHHSTRIRTPLVKKDGVFVQATWEEALRLVGDKLKAVKEQKGSGRIAAIASTRCTNEENYLFQKLVRGVFGTNNIDNYARLEHAPSMIALNNTLGFPAATNSLKEIMDAQVILVIGANPTASHVIAGLKIKQAVRNNGAELILVDPGKTSLVPFSKLWLRVNPGTDVALLNGMARVIIDDKLIDKDFIDRRTQGYAALKDKLAAYSPEQVAEICGISAAAVTNVARLFAKAEIACIVYGDGLTQQTSGVNNVYTLLNLLLLTGNLGKKGAGIHPLRATCNIQGASDMGALPDYLPGYQSLRDDAVRRKLETAWGLSIPGAAGLTIMEMIEAACEDKLSAMYVMGENPVLAFPQRERVKTALEKLDFLVVQDIFLTETAQLADVVLPAASFAEKSGTFTSTDRRVQKINPAIAPLAESKPDSEILQLVAESMGSSLGYSSPAEVMREISEVVPIYEGIRYQGLGVKGLQWPLNAEGKGTEYITDFSEPLIFHAVDYVKAGKKAEFPFTLLSGGLLFPHMSGTMTAKSKGLPVMDSEGELLINPLDAEALKVKDGDRVVLESDKASLTVKTKCSDRYMRGIVFLPTHFSATPVNLLMGGEIDEKSCTPASKITRVRIKQCH